MVKAYYTPMPEKILMPDVQGKVLDEAVRVLSENGLKKGGISYMDSETCLVDHVICQGVMPGESINRGESLDLLISRGPRPISYVMPDFIGMTIQRVQAFLLAHGLKVSKIESITYPGLEQGVIVKQYPHSGYRINARNLITFGVSR
jgi:serine/threonine-protein kinase